ANPARATCTRQKTHSKSWRSIAPVALDFYLGMPSALCASRTAEAKDVCRNAPESGSSRSPLDAGQDCLPRSVIHFSSPLPCFDLLSWGLKFRCIRIDADRHAVDKRERLARRGKQRTTPSWALFYEDGGPDLDRADDLFHAMEARSQLRHRPTFREVLK